jgi:SAM-dependent methyltransferase
MSENPTGSEWAAGRGQTWSAHLLEMEAMLAPVDEPLISALRLDTPCRIADIGCGGGGTSFGILQRALAGSVVHGFDISPAQIESARRRVSPDERAIAFEVADVGATVPGLPYDRLVSRFGIMFFEDPPAAFANLLRWLGPGGRFAFAVWGYPADNPWMITVREVVSEVIELPPADPEAPGPFRYGDADRLVTLLARTGFADLEVFDWRGKLPIGGGLPATKAAHFALTSFSSFADRLAQAGDVAFNTAHRSLTARLSGYERDSVVQMDACAHVISGRSKASEISVRV